MISPRFENWPGLLDQAIAAARETPFAWGQHDCVLFAADCIAAMTGVDPAAEWRGSYDSAEGAAGILDQLGVPDLEGLINVTIGVPLENPRLGQRGDIALVPTEHGPAAGVIALSGRHVALAGANGLVFAPLSDALMVWRV